MRFQGSLETGQPRPAADLWETAIAVEQLTVDPLTLIRQQEAASRTPR